MSNVLIFGDELRGILGRGGNAIAAMNKYINDVMKQPNSIDFSTLNMFAHTVVDNCENEAEAQEAIKVLLVNLERRGVTELDDYKRFALRLTLRSFPAMYHEHITNCLTNVGAEQALQNSLDKWTDIKSIAEVEGLLRDLVSGEKADRNLITSARANVILIKSSGKLADVYQLCEDCYYLGMDTGNHQQIPVFINELLRSDAISNHAITDGLRCILIQHSLGESGELLAGYEGFQELKPRINQIEFGRRVNLPFEAFQTLGGGQGEEHFRGSPVL